MKTPDIMVTVNKDTVILEPQTVPAVRWLRNRGGLDVDSPHDKVHLNRREWHHLDANLEGAGLVVWVDH